MSGRYGSSLVVTLFLLVAFTACDSSSVAPSDNPPVVVDRVAPTAVLTAPATMSAGQDIPLDGRDSFDSGTGRVVRYAWTRLSGGGGATGSMPLDQPVVTEAPTFTATSPAADPLLPGRHRFRLVVVDDSGNESAPDEVEVVVIDDLSPTAVLTAPASVSAGQNIPLDGRDSFDSGTGRVVRYVWTRLSGGGGATGSMPLDQPVVTEAPTFTATSPAADPLLPGRHRFRLVVVDDSGNESAPDEVEVVVTDDLAPTAVLTAPATMSAGQPIPLDGSSSFDAGTGRVVRYVWTRLSGGGGATGSMPLDQPVVTEAPTFTATSPAADPLLPGRHRFRLVVVDDSGNESAPDEVEVVVTTP